MTDSTGEFDLIVVGGGPGGSTLATLVAMQGHKVLVLERERFPRHQIGESLLPATIHGICPLLGLSEQIKAANFMRKSGGTFRWGKNRTPWTFNFASSSSTSSTTGYAYQVERSRFDAILLTNARAKGAQVREQCRVNAVLVEQGRVRGVRWVDEKGQPHTAYARFLADASGNESLIYGNVAQRVYSKFFQNVALYAYYRNGKRLESPNQGNILSAAFDGGWFWYIPLSDTLTSVGAVVSQEHADILRDGHVQALEKFVSACPIIKKYLSGAERITEGEYGKIRVRKDYSYCCTTFWRPGMMLIGDAACFVDPVFSSGVHLATYSGLLAARSVNSCLRGSVDETRAFSEFELRYRREYGNFYQFLVSFYDMNQDEESYFWAARNILSTAERANEAFVNLVAGVGASGEPLFGNSEEFFTAMTSVSNSFRRAQSVPGEFRMAALDKAFMNAFTQESVQLQMRAAFADSEPEMPLWRSGLIPTSDGVHWCEATPAGQ